MENRQLNFDVSRGGIQHRLFVRVGDTNSRMVSARMYSGSDAVPITAAHIRALRPDGTQIYSECAVQDGGVVYTFTTEDLACGGELQCEFDLHNGESVMTSPRFIVVCEKQLYTGEGIETSDEYKAYISALLKLENLTVDAVSGESAAVAKEVTDTGIALHFTLPKGDKGDSGKQYALIYNNKIYVGDKVYGSLSEFRGDSGLSPIYFQNQYDFYYLNQYSQNDFGGENVDAITCDEYVPLVYTYSDTVFGGLETDSLTGVGHCYVGDEFKQYEVKRNITIRDETEWIDNHFTTKLRTFLSLVEDYTNDEIDTKIEDAKGGPITVTEDISRYKRNLVVKQGDTVVATVNAAGKLVGQSWLMTDYSDSTIDGNYTASFGFNNKSSGNGSIIGGIKNTVNGRALGVFGEKNSVKTCATGAIIGGTYADVDDDTVVFAIGNGTSDTERSNALVVHTDGTIDGLKSQSTDIWKITKNGTKAIFSVNGEASSFESFCASVITHDQISDCEVWLYLSEDKGCKLTGVEATGEWPNEYDSPIHRYTFHGALNNLTHVSFVVALDEFSGAPLNYSITSDTEEPHNIWKIRSSGRIYENGFLLSNDADLANAGYNDTNELGSAIKNNEKDRFIYAYDDGAYTYEVELTSTQIQNRIYTDYDDMDIYLYGYWKNKKYTVFLRAIASETIACYGRPVITVEEDYTNEQIDEKIEEAKPQEYFGIEETLLSEQTVEFVPQEWITGWCNASFACESALAVGEKYRVLFDGTEYFCTVKDSSEHQYNGLVLKGLYIGNLGLWNTPFGLDAFPDTGEPFYCTTVDGLFGLNILSDTTESHTVSVQKVKTLDSRWIDDSVVTKDYLEKYIDQYISEALGGEY